MNRSLVLLTMGFVLSIMLISTVSGSTSVNQTSIFSCNQDKWNQASESGNLQINVCTPVVVGDTNYGYGNNEPSVQYAVYYNQATVASGTCSLGPCSNPTAVGVENSYLILRFYPGNIYGMQIIGSDSNVVWLPYNGGYPGYQTCNSDLQFCFAQNQSYCSNPQSCSAVVFRIEATPITINVFFNQPS